MDEMLTAYIEAALWSSHDLSRGDDGQNPPLDERLSVADVNGPVLEEMRDDCKAFQEANTADIALYCERLGFGAEQVGHDFWLTREGHGAGFWDRYYGPDTELRAAINRLTDAAKVYGTFDAIHEL